MERQLRGCTQRRLADALHLENIDADVRGLLSGVKFVMMELEQVS